MQSILGIDVSKASLDMVLMTEARKTHVVFSNDQKGFKQLNRWLISQQVGEVHACLEATGQYGFAIAEYLHGLGYAVSMVNPARIKHYGESKLHRNKTDKADAELIAEFCLKENPALWQPLPPDLKHLRALVRRLDDLQTNHQQEKNRLKSGERDPYVIANLTEHVNYLEASIKALKKEIQDYIDQNPSMKSKQDLISSIPGIGDLTAAKLLAEITDISSFDGAPQLAAYAGLNPKGFRSGSSVHKKTRISKQGRSELRYYLYMPAIVAMKCNSVIRALKERLYERRLPMMAIVAAAMRKLLHMVYGVLKNNKPFDPDYDKQFNYLT
jgi:transposase